MISINATLFVQIINLLVLLVILNYVMYRPLRRLVAERQQALRQGHEAAVEQAARNQAEQQKYQADLRKGRAGIQERLQHLHRQTEVQGLEVITLAQEQAREKVRQMNEKVEQQMNEARQDIRGQAEQVAATMASQILRRGVS